MITKNLLQARRLQLKMSLEDVAVRVGVNKSTVHRWETGNIANLGQDKIAKLAAALQVSPEYLLGWTDDPGLRIEEEFSVAVADLTDEERREVLNYIAFLKAQRRAKK